jgi:ABC-type uncharacterized transport system ATPase subunit
VKILVLDGTAVLTPQEINDLFKVMRSLTARGIDHFITHKLKEVLRCRTLLPSCAGGGGGRHDAFRRQNEQACNHMMVDVR